MLENVRRTSYFTIATSLVVNAFLLLYVLKQLDGVNQLNEDWNKAAQLSLEKAENLAQLERAFGYVGFIHHFKNYIIRRDDNYYKLAKESYKNASQALAALSATKISEKDAKNISILRETLDIYASKLEQARQLWSHHNVNELDRLVKVDDSPAANALEQIRQSLQQQLTTHYKLASNNTDKLNQYTLMSTLIAVPLILLLTGIIIFSLQRLSTLYSENATILDASPDGIIYAESNGKILKANPAASKMFAYSNKELSTMVIEDLLSEQLRQSHRQYRDAFNTEVQSKMMGQRGGPIIGKKKGGQDIEVNIAISSIEVGDTMRNIAIIRDVTEHKRLQHIAHTDELTQINNRWALTQTISQEVDIAYKNRGSLSLMLFNVDDLHQINKTKSHLIGDQILKELAEFLKNYQHDSKYIGRWKNDEFILLFHDQTEQVAIALADTIRYDFSYLAFPWADKVTLSAGVAVYDRTHDSISANGLIYAASKALYKAKLGGGNKVEIYQEEN